MFFPAPSLIFCVFCLQVLCEDKSVEDVLQRHFNSSKDFRSMHMLLVRLLASFLLSSLRVWILHINPLIHCRFQMLCLSRVSVSKPAIRPADLLEASRLCFADAKANMLHGKNKNPHKNMSKKSSNLFNICVFSLQGCPSWSCASSSPLNTWTTSTKESRSTSRWFTTVRRE